MRVKDISHARQLTKAGYPFLRLSKPKDIKDTAKNYIEDGWPMVDMLSSKESTLADCERIRNRIAHNSIEARVQFAIVQRNYLQTERTFDLSAGQFLRIRNTRLHILHILHMIEALSDTLDALISPRL